MSYAHKPVDALVRARLREWPQCPPGLQSGKPVESWLRGRPADVSGGYQPYLKYPGSDRFRTMPDGLWLHFGGSAREPFVDVFAIEACSSLPNLLDKRSRFAPSTQSLMALCPLPWLLAAVAQNEPLFRWQITGVLEVEPNTALILPVRDVRVMYGLPPRHYAGFTQHQVPHPHEYFVPMDRLTDKGAANDPSVQAFVGRARAAQNFFTAV